MSSPISRAEVMKEMEDILSETPNMSALLKSAEIAVQNQTKLADAAMMAALAFKTFAEAWQTIAEKLPREE